MKQIIIMMLAMTSIVACRKEDNSAPVISKVLVNGAASDEHSMQVGTTMTVLVSCNDNEELKQLKVNIHSADDGHNHEGETGEEVGPNIGTWSALRIVDIDGTTSDQSMSFVVPDSIAGHWHLEVQLIDATGNEAEEFITTLHVENDNLPLINVLSTIPAQNADGVIVLAIGGTPGLTGDVSDPDGLQMVHLTIENETSGDIIWESMNDNIGSNIFDLSTVVFTTINEAGSYHLHIHATDVNGFENIMEFEMTVE